MTIYEKLAAHRDEILRIAEQYGARNVCVFGSVARGEADEQSNLDLLVALDKGRTLLDLGGLVYDLMELRGCSVDVVTEGALQGEFRERVIGEVRTLEEVTT